VRYTAYGHTLESAVRLRGLTPSPRPADIRILASRRPPVDDSTPAALSDRGVDGPWLQLRRSGDSLVLQFDGGGTFTLSSNGGVITVHIDDDGLTDTVTHLLIDQVLPLALGQRGRLVIHGSGVVLDGRAVAFVGPAGAGKSTLAGSLGRHGGIVIADDALVVEALAEAILIEPAYPAIRVWPDVLDMLGAGNAQPSIDARAGKRLLGVNQGLSFVSTRARLERIYFVQPAPSDDIVIARLTDRDATIDLLSHTFVLDPSDRFRLARHFEQACEVVERTIVRTISFPRGRSYVDDVRREICRDLTS
jgi:hypothetical protein